MKKVSGSLVALLLLVVCWSAIQPLAAPVSVAVAQNVEIDTSQPPVVVNSSSNLGTLTVQDGRIIIIRTGAASGLMYYSASSSATIDDVDVINGPGGVGRYLRLAGGSGAAALADVANKVADVTALLATSPTDNQLYQTLGYTTEGVGANLYRYDAASTATIDGGFVLPGPGGTLSFSGTTFNGNAGTGGRFIAVDQTAADTSQFGAIYDGSTDSTNAILRAVTFSQLTWITGQAKVTDTVTMPSGAEIRATIDGEIVVANKWANKPVLVLGDNCQVDGLAVTETSASAIDSDKNQASNVGIDVQGVGCIVSNCKSTGFAFPFMCRDGSADGSRDGVAFVDCVGSKGYSWGFEIDSVQNAKFIRCVAHTNGLDGFKAQNEYDRTCDGLIYESCESYGNGQRDTSAGGAESTNGNGWDLFHGGYRAKLDKCRAYANYGAGFNIKGGAGLDPIQGEIQVVNCEFTGNLATSIGTTSGVEIGTGGDVGGSIISFVGCTISENDGNGAYVLGGYGVTFTNCHIVKNKSYGAYLSVGTDTSFAGCKFFRNSDYQLAVGFTNDGSYVSKRISIADCIFSASYDPFMASSSSVWSAAKEQLTFTADSGTDVLTSTAHGLIDGETVQFWTYSGTLPTGITSGTLYWVINSAANTFQIATSKGGSAVNITADGSGTLYATRDSELGIRVYSNSADVTIERCTFANHWGALGHLYTLGKRVVVEDCKFYQGKSSALLVGGGDATVSRCYFKDPDYTTGATNGVLAVSGGAAYVHDCTFERTGTASGYAVRFSSGAAGGKFHGIAQSNFTAGVFVSAGATFASGWVQDTTGTAAPTGSDYYWIAGAICWNSAPSSANPEYWRCTVAGSPGTWSAGPNHP